jgi:hypothetical protein
MQVCFLLLHDILNIAPLMPTYSFVILIYTSSPLFYDPLRHISTHDYESVIFTYASSLPFLIGMLIYASLPLALGLRSTSHLYSYLWHGSLLHGEKFYKAERSGDDASVLDVVNAPAVLLRRINFTRRATMTGSILIARFC